MGPPTAPLRVGIQKIILTDLELSLRIRRSPTETLVIEVKEGEAVAVLEVEEPAKDVPFQKRKKK